MSNSNTIHFGQNDKAGAMIPAIRPTVFYDGKICCFLEVHEVVLAGNNEFGYAKLFYNSANPDEVVPVERIETLVAMGKPVRISRVYDGGFGQAEPRTIDIFSGLVDSVTTKISPVGETVEIVARDISASLERTIVHGQRVATDNGETMFLDGFELIFNADGASNACREAVEYNGSSYTVFSTDNDNSRQWTCAQAVRYLLCEYLPAVRLYVPGIDQLEAVFEGVAAGAVDVDGASLISAVSTLCRQAGVKFRFVSPANPVGPYSEVVFYRPGFGAKVELNCQKAPESLTITKTNVTELESKRSFWPVTHRYIGMGDFKLFEATFDLVKAWDGSFEGGSQASYSRLAGGFDQVRNVYRRWCLNEAGDYTDPPYDQGEAFDLSFVFETDHFAKHRRKFQKALTTDADSESLGYYLEVSYNSGTNWQEYTGDFDVLDDQCGIWLSDDELTTELYNAAIAETLWFRITATVASDERLTREVCNGPVNSTAEVIDHISTLSSGFKFRKVSPASIFWRSTDDGIGVPDETDDGDMLAERLRRTVRSTVNTIETVEAQMPFAAMSYCPGQNVITGPDARDITGAGFDNRSVFWIERVSIDFVKQCTTLKILRSRCYG